MPYFRVTSTCFGLSSLQAIFAISIQYLKIYDNNNGEENCDFVNTNQVLEIME